MKHAYVFPGQGAQAVGMGKDLYDNVPEAKELFEKANDILGFRITDIMFAGTDDELKAEIRRLCAKTGRSGFILGLSLIHISEPTRPY